MTQGRYGALTLLRLNSTTLDRKSKLLSIKWSLWGKAKARRPMRRDGAKSSLFLRLKKAERCKCGLAPRMPCIASSLGGGNFVSFPNKFGSIFAAKPHHFEGTLRICLVRRHGRCATQLAPSFGDFATFKCHCELGARRIALALSLGAVLGAIATARVDCGALAFTPAAYSRRMAIWAVPAARARAPTTAKRAAEADKLKIGSRGGI